MMEAGYRPTGWLGLLLGSRLYFNFHDSAVKTEALFEQQIDAVERELAGRGKGAAEGVPPAQTRALTKPTPTPTPAPAPTPAPTAVPAPIPTTAPPVPASSMPSSIQQQQVVSPAPGMFQHREDDLTLFQLMLEREDHMRQEAKAELEQLRDELKPKPLLSEEALGALQVRLSVLHAAQLLNDEQLHELEDLCADYIELNTEAPGGFVTAELARMSQDGGAWRLVRLARLSAGIEADASFARQAIRKFCST